MASNKNGQISDKRVIEVRLCHLKKASDNVEYGFNLKGKSYEDSHIIGKVDDK